MSKKPDGRRPRVHRGPAQPRAGCLVEDVDGVTAIVRSSVPLTEQDREHVRAFVEALKLGPDGDTMPVDVTLPPDLTPLSEAVIWLRRGCLPDVPRVT